MISPSLRWPIPTSGAPPSVLALRIAAFPVVARACAGAVAVIAIARSAIAVAVVAVWAALVVPTRTRAAIVGALGIVLASSEGVAAAVTTGSIVLAAIAIAPEICAVAANWMDRALLVQTYAGRPMTTHHVLESAAPFDRTRLATAVAELVRSTPVLRSFVREAPLGIRRFAVPDACHDALVYSDERVDLDESGWYLRAFALAREAPIRVLHAPRLGGGYALVLTLHHSVADGAGALALFDALLAHYEGRALPPLERDGAGLGRVIRRLGLRCFASALRHGVGRFRQIADRRGAVLERVDAPVEKLCAAVIDIPLARWHRLREHAEELGCTRNDLLSTAMLRASVAWRREQGLPDEELRMLVPVDLRALVGVGRSLSNHLGTVEADFRVDEIDAPSLPRTVAARVKAERAPACSLRTPIALAVLGTLVPPFLARRCFRWIDERPGSFMYSFLFSYIHAPTSFRVSSAIGIRRLYCLSALPRQPGIGLTITALPDAVTAALAYTPPRTSERGARSLLEHFERELAEVAR